MRSTKTISISLPPEQLKAAERLAKKQSRTMSELMREAFRRYQQEEEIKPATLADAIRLLRADATAKGLNKLTKRKIDAVIAETRREMAGTTKKAGRSHR